MGFLNIVLVLLVGCSPQYFVNSHSYHFGQCPSLEPMTDFSMEMVSHNSEYLDFRSSPLDVLLKDKLSNKL